MEHGPADRARDLRPAEDAERQTARAEKLTKEAADLIACEPARAETLLREALTLDLFFGPAHNNLGVLFLQRGDLYAAASEFEWARKLMPGHPDPHVNLGITLERAGRTADAVASYSAALESCPDYLPAVQGLAKVALLERREEPRLARWLDQIALSGTNESWRSWAAAQRAGQGR